MLASAMVLATAFDLTVLAGLLPALPVILTDEQRQELAEYARMNALNQGISGEDWQRHRRGNEVGRDLLMAVDPVGEAVTIKKERKLHFLAKSDG